MAAERRQYPLLNSQQLEEHLGIFALDWEQKLTHLGWTSDEIDLPSDIGWKEQHHQLRCSPHADISTIFTTGSLQAIFISTF